MTSRLKVLALIPARGGSKGLPRKNVLVAADKPLIALTIEAALTARCVSKVVLSSDDDEIIDVARNYGCDVPFKRPESLASDTSSSVEVVCHALQELPGYDYVVLLQPTSPLRNARDIDEAFELMVTMKAPACVSLKPVSESPYWMYQINGAGRLKTLIDSESAYGRRQDLPPVYALNGAIYMAEVSWFLTSRTFISAETVGYIMPQERSLDIDTADDFLAFKAIVEK